MSPTKSGGGEQSKKARAAKPPKAYREFVKRFPELGQAWELLREGEQRGPLDDKTLRLVKLAAAIGAQREGAVHSAVRKARSAGASRKEIDQVVVAAASTIGLPSTVAVFSWIEDDPRR